jgi:DsbC/DsbD-like thiol-disulfide interchange protein
MPAIALRTAFLAALALPAPAIAAHSDWAEADEAQLRLLLEPPTRGGILGGIEIVLNPEWYTYWRNPGEAGVPPAFDFSGSENVAEIEVRYPTPSRRDDGTSVSLIYMEEVVFPLVVSPSDASRPVTVRVKANFGVCSEICIPTGAMAQVTSSEAPDPLSTARIASFAGRVPGAPDPGRFDIRNVIAEEGALLIEVLMPESSTMDLFADPPAGWYVGQPAFVEREGEISRYRLSLSARPHEAPILGQTFTFVAVSGGEAIEKTVEIR